MTEGDREKFARLMFRMAAHWNRALEPSTVGDYWLHLRRHDLLAVTVAFEKLMTTSQYFPQIRELLPLLKVRPEHREFAASQAKRLPGPDSTAALDAEGNEKFRELYDLFLGDDAVSRDGKKNILRLCEARIRNRVAGPDRIVNLDDFDPPAAPPPGENKGRRASDGS